ncbi:DUF1501 domain-containing protein [Tuwongella immobilis]|uniref:DUF1501 domain-containing protein n=1 Tax=Tuwongella immobilis TaxID=692036 RepID=A0A6C2YN95_9BACT|nr:DUF1501 domain-containing protein [Tuwongella immobilis]VIP02847.1 hypothetical protein : Uncharacterized protein OS=Pirellula staleyi (strain ATCC 27377 / DSM 6068 / ICPB 4128) GN=Psta_4532 PE=4 SV=1: DUF1501 [Tuwongella immobilis]VTS02629.1 hypothetical protein : Uncharacterized protein OS=Pirellula staleyi (strain ATCC 27377 / DSM 6068 / ICPB 4128) GN=Psta_4532 PE=4 SV=1: DUF1501 [Tuwongella immobilis]
MLTVQSPPQGMSRRHWLTIGALGWAGLSLESLFRCQNAVAESSGKRLDLTGKSVIFIHQQGGPSQYETTDPKPNAAMGIRTIGTILPTRLPGHWFGETYAELAKLADKLTIVKSYATQNAEHNIRPMVGPESLQANLGSLISRVVGPIDSRSLIPTNVVLFAQSVASDVAKGSARGNLAATGALGSQTAPFIPGGGGQLQKNLKLNLTLERFTDRSALLQQFDSLRRRVEPRYADYSREQQQAMDVLLGGSVANALDLSQEDPQILAQYDTSATAIPDGGKKVARGRRGYYAGHARSFGKALLQARRLVETGCRFVTVHTGYEGIWDMHADTENLNMADGMRAVGPAFDRGLACLIRDLETRGMLDDVLVIATGEMGRTPRINRNGGRDHWARLTPLILAGAGVSRGAVIGQSTADGGEPLSDAVNSTHLVSTILHTTLDVGQMRLMPELAALSKLAETPPIPGTAG